VSAPATYTLKAGWFKVSNDVVDKLLACMSGPVAKAYMAACRFADAHGKFWCSYHGLAKVIGSDVRYGRRVMDRLREAGLVQLVERGGPTRRRANVYQLGFLDQLDLAKVKTTLSKPLDGEAATRRQRSRERQLVGAAHGTK
jgi:hypothetical protein